MNTAGLRRAFGSLRAVTEQLSGPLLQATRNQKDIWRRGSESTDFQGFLEGLALIFSGILLNPGLPGVTGLNHFGARFGAH